MLFNSGSFFLFFPLVVATFFALPRKWRIWFLLLTSYFFYGFWRVEYLGLIIFSTVVDFLVGQKISKSKYQFHRKSWLWVSIIINLGVLFYFKYFNFFADSVSDLLWALGLDYIAPYTNVILPIGISFYTFQSMSYSIDIYKKRLMPESRFEVFALYVSYFPQLVAGPIERASRLIPQLKKHSDFEYDRVVSGLKQMLWGFFKKVVIADNLAANVDLIYSSPESYGGLILLFATYCFAFQIYCDFSGYSDIAIGAARVLGVKLMENFDLPYLSKSIPEFWRRWHISLSTWFRDYVFIPLGGNRVTALFLVLNILTVFMVSGLWHGASWNFVIWGGLHGLLYLIFKHFEKLTKRIPSYIGIFITFHLVLICWIFFRATDLDDALQIINSIFTDFTSIAGIPNMIGPGEIGQFCFVFALVLGFILFDPVMTKIIRNPKQISNTQSHILFGSLLTSILMFGYFEEINFIYFQF